ncbi:ABC transporter permease [Ethanoligenens harbinense]|uniref:Binding-protein-dependent transport systems inner membrane component n=1 Tax=Ethanoligenens harbinense (strain DSM 18485 / JCM 12961 / CGMCC 1.5033 / YUAN-3) TaxID=663278 RepID=E6U4C9_ETHHY|nr:iron ABC transporter permease [Ethanoligenens harbinense]ADU27736.1 binding-protein-dependent transport systems inner membrane component [Ethanoligenens harbinense YUAN-3]AVQ96765.1 iron ABC transporter permease [Ethanoligenens harbinense YUAN-3]AYF39427.1 iron ABC transporter permease [Ethanoligenens harbinense]AYF42251.1 iron ABC transporter permease [Ethanoligenens harbinense]QCN93007.1 iron ABC transporter permease [Ethanoligenens harbinense]
MPVVIKRRLGDMAQMKKDPLVLISVILLLVCSALFIVWPVFRVLGYAAGSDFSLFFRAGVWRNAMLHSLFLTALATLTGTAAAFLFAYTIVRLPVPLKKLFHFVTILPILSPPFILSLSYILLFGGQGIVTNRILGLHVNIFGWQGLWFVQTITFFPYAYAVMEGVLSSIPPSLEYAAANLGATRLRVFLDVTLPLCRPGIAGGALMVAINVLTDFGNPVMIGGNYSVLPTEAYMQVVGIGNLSTASMLTTMLLIPAVLIFLMNKYWITRRSYVTVTGKGNGMTLSKTPPAVKWVLFGVCMLFSLVVLSVYGILFYGSFTKLWGYDWTPSLKNYLYVFFAGGQIVNSILYALLSALLSSIIGAATAYLVQKKHTGLGRVLDFFAVIPGAVPGIFLGLGFAIAFNEPPLFLTGTTAIMVIALTVWNLPNCYTASTAALEQIGDSIEEASLNLGGGSLLTFRRIILPLLRAPFLSGFMVAFLRSVTCLSVVIFIYSVNTMVGTISILNFVQTGLWGSAAALTVLLIACSFAVMGVIRLLLRRQSKMGRNERVF